MHLSRVHTYISRELPKCLIALHNLKEYLIHLCNYPYCLRAVRWKYRLIKIVHRQIAMVHLIRHSIFRIYRRMHAYEEGNSVHFIFVIFAAIFTTNEKEKNKMEKSARERNTSNLAVRRNRKRKKEKKRKRKKNKNGKRSFRSSIRFSFFSSFFFFFTMINTIAVRTIIRINRRQRRQRRR